MAQAGVQDETHLLERLRAGDERAFAELVDSCHTTMLAVAQAHVRSRAVAEEVVQEAWMGVIRGVDGFEGRSSLKTWILRIVVNTAKTRGVREARSVPFASLGPNEPAVDPTASAVPTTATRVAGRSSPPTGGSFPTRRSTSAQRST